jgi:hypothetical protein
MSTRGINFLDKWLSEHLPDVITDDPVAVSELADELMKAADREGIAPDEINEEVDSVFEVIFEAMQHREGSSPESHLAVLDLLATRLAREANVTEEQARELIRLNGTNWSSLLREAHFLKHE